MSRFPPPRRANPRAGEGHGRSAKGHFTSWTGNYKHGTYRAQCDICGFDFHAEDMRLTWDNLFVCGGCWEPRHPQDFVRGHKDQMSPGGPLRPENEGGHTPVSDGSTEVPDGTFSQGLTTISAPAPVNQTNDPGDIVSVDVSAWVGNETNDTITYSAINLPTGLSINSTSGVVSGTVDTDAQDTVFTPTITTTYDTEGISPSFDFTWTISDLVLPTDITGLQLWWDFSDTTTTWQDRSRTTAATAAGEDIQGVTDKSGNGNHGSYTTGPPKLTTKTDAWGLAFAGSKLVAYNSGNSYNMDDNGGMTDSLAGNAATFICVAKFPPGDDLVLISNRGNGSNDYSYVSHNGAPNDKKFGAIDNSANQLAQDETRDQGTWGASGGVLMVTMVRDGTTCTLYWNTTQVATTDSFDSLSALQGFSLGAGSGGTQLPWREGIAEGLVYNKALSASERSNLFSYMDNKWSLSDASDHIV